MGKDKPFSPSRKHLLYYALCRGLVYDYMTRRSPSKVSLIEDLKKRGFNPNKETAEIAELKRGLKTWILRQKAKELNVFTDAMDDDKLYLATAIYCKSQDALRDLQKYQRSEPKRKVFSFAAAKEIPLTRWMSKSDDIRQTLAKRLSNPQESGIATIDVPIRVGEKLRYNIDIDRKKKTYERKPDPRFPGRKGPHDDFPIHRIVVTYDGTTNKLEVSASDKAAVAIEAIAEVISGKKDFFQPIRPSAPKAIEILSDNARSEELKNYGIKIIELELRNIQLKGSPSLLYLYGDDIHETIKIFSEKDIPIIGSNVSEISFITLQMQDKKILINFSKGSIEKTGRFTDEDHRKVEEFLSRLGIC